MLRGGTQNRQCITDSQVVELIKSLHWLHDAITPDIPDDDLLHGDLCSVAGDTFSSLARIFHEQKAYPKFQVQSEF